MDESDIEPQYAYWTVPEEQRQAYNENKVSYLHKLVSVELREDKYNPGKFSVQQLPISDIAFQRDTINCSKITFIDNPEFTDSVYPSENGAKSLYEQEFEVNESQALSTPNLRKEKSEQEPAHLQETHTKKSLLNPPPHTVSEIDRQQLKLGQNKGWNDRSVHLNNDDKLSISRISQGDQ